MINDSLTSRASVLTSGECKLLFYLNAVLIVGVQLPLVVRAIHWVRSEAKLRIRISQVIIVGVSGAVGGVAVSRGVVCSSSSQCSDRTDELRSGEACQLRQSALIVFLTVECKGENTFCFVSQESVKVISWCCPADLGCDLVDISSSLLTLWLLLWCGEGHVVLVSNPWHET